MLRTLLDTRTLLAMAVALAVGVWGLRTYPVVQDQVFLALIETRRPDLHQGLVYTYALLWFTTPFFGASLLGSLFAIVTYRHAPPPDVPRASRVTSSPEERPAPSLVLGEVHHETRPGRALDPEGLRIPQRGLYTGLANPSRSGRQTSGTGLEDIAAVLGTREAGPSRQKSMGLASASSRLDTRRRPRVTAGLRP